ncbi:hypothetical protein B0T16DRAFT_407875 [Cercophora newfieldiana]|uniref:Uncharacterized protein n=1 Tax=Cercophora newfieldiana TaxID=92897 RepID=A0AA40CR76_9PEZI|nr:hypothetical protein B0T16DRAFT_407875 [Cercophora newfieldiana]
MAEVAQSTIDSATALLSPNPRKPGNLEPTLGLRFTMWDGFHVQTGLASDGGGATGNNPMCNRNWRWCRSAVLGLRLDSIMYKGRIAAGIWELLK